MKASEDYAVTLSRFAAGLSLHNLPSAAVLAAKTNMFDTLACAAAGSSAEGIGELRALGRLWAGARQVRVLVFGDQLPAHHAAWINGAMAHARDYDDTHDAAVLHAGVAVVPAALAAAELAGGASGADLIAGVAAGLETICRLGVATRIGIVASGYMYTALFGHFAATVAASRVLGLGETQIVNALGISYSQVAGNHQVTRDAALTKRMQPGFAAMSALIAVQMAQLGIRGVQNTFEGEDGFLRVYLRDRCDRAALRAGLGEDFAFTQLSYKPWPCCRFTHPAIEAALDLRKTIAARIDRIDHIRVGLNHQAYEAVCTPVDVRTAPKTVVQAQFSIPWTIAAALTDGAVKLRHFTHAALARADLLALAGKVETYVDANIEHANARHVSPVVLEITLNDGSRHPLRIDTPLGHPNKPMSTADFDAKARDCLHLAARALGEDATTRLRNQVERLETANNVNDLIQVLAPDAVTSDG